jgi:hypothetical protein
VYNNYKGAIMNHDMISVSQSTQPHKFFERYLDNDLNNLSEELRVRYEKIKNADVLGVTPLTEKDLWQESNSVSTMKWRQYNVFQFSIPEIYSLYLSIREMAKEACEYYDIDFEKQRYMLQGWFNINSNSKGGKLNWHDHGPNGAPAFHGYYCVNAEPSTTHYVVFDKRVENVNKNNRAILSEMGHPHAMGDWDWDGDRITVAYDLLPLDEIVSFGMENEQHWIPLA